NIQHWVTGLNVAPIKNNLPYDEEFADNPIIEDLWRAKEKGDLIINKTYFKKEKNYYFSYLTKHNDASRVPEAVRNFINDAETFTVTLAAERNCIVGLDSWSERVTSEEDFQILKRFARVFQQAYTRFLDLQRAEAQAREARIEAALEKVRSRTIGMQRSDELQDAALLMFQQVQALGVPSFAAGFNIWDEDRKAATAWMAQEFVLQPPFKTSSAEDIFFYIHEAAERGEALFIREQRGEELETHYRYMASIPTFKGIMENMAQAGHSVPTFQIIHCAFFSQGYLVFITYEPVPEAYDIFKRFAKVFEQTYTRFLDLQKAEAQAREAQIEAALERVRSQSLAMHRSDELKDVIAIMFKKMNELKVLHGTVAIQLFDFQTKDSIFWAGNDFQYEPQKVSLPYDEKIMGVDTCHRDLWEAMTKGEIIFNKVYSKEKKDKWFQYVFAKNDLSIINNNTRETILQAEIHTLCFIPEKHSALFADSWDGSVYTRDELNVLKRAAKVFEQAYVRFLDLQKAEAQAREAQIQLALERVRARTMAMQKSNELNDVAALLFRQVSDLGIKIWTTGFKVWSDDNNFFTDYVTNPLGGFMEPYTIDSTQYPVFVELSKAKKRGDEFLVNCEEGEQLAETYRKLSTYGEKQFKAI
ncbi:MAG: hypothetical protein ICV66_11985, partial [Chitinophagaceae bacterium]|nr:hypothetical protein [Chitinophagaceae bacterium]